MHYVEALNSKDNFSEAMLCEHSEPKCTFDSNVNDNLHSFQLLQKVTG